MGSQERKQLLSLAGEFLVAGELNRRLITASITFGASKRADIFAYHSDWKFPVRIEVKTTDKKKWVVGSKPLDSDNWRNDWFWVLVYIPRGIAYESNLTAEARGATSPRYFVFTSKEIGRLTRHRMQRYNKRYKDKHGKDYTSKSVHSISFDDASTYEGSWHKIQSFFLKGQGKK